MQEQLTFNIYKGGLKSSCDDVIYAVNDFLSMGSKYYNTKKKFVNRKGDYVEKDKITSFTNARKFHLWYT